jgi:hypothetical protein
VHPPWSVTENLFHAPCRCLTFFSVFSVSLWILMMHLRRLSA